MVVRLVYHSFQILETNPLRLTSKTVAGNVRNSIVCFCETETIFNQLYNSNHQYSGSIDFFHVVEKVLGRR